MEKKDKYVHNFVWTEGFSKEITPLVKQMGNADWAWRSLLYALLGKGDAQGKDSIRDLFRNAIYSILKITILAFSKYR